MPYLWAQQTSFFDETLCNDMFYPQGVVLSKKEKLSLIWLAANYDPEKYKKIIPARDCESVNITRICYAIINPTYPYALRLSAQLMLGTVRVYRTKTNLLLNMAEQMMIKLSGLVKEARGLDLPISMLKVDSITLPETMGTVLDYTLGPVVYNPSMIMHLNEDEFFSVNRTPLTSPVKLEKRARTVTSPPLTVSNRQISLDENLMPSPSKKPIPAPGEELFEGADFGPQNNFLNDLNFDEEPQISRGFGTTITSEGVSRRLAPLFEIDEVNNEAEEPTSLKRKTNTDVEELATAIQQEANMQVAEDPVDLDDLMRQAMELSRTCDPLPMHEEDELPSIPPENFADDTTILPGHPYSTDLTRDGQTTAVGQPSNWDLKLMTPSEAIVLKPMRNNPRKKRKLCIDNQLILTNKEIKRNLATPETLFRTPMVAGAALADAKQLFNQPSVAGINKNKKLNGWWRRCATAYNAPLLHHPQVSLETPAVAGELPNTQLEEMENPTSPKLERKNTDTPASIEQARADGSMMRSMEKSTASLLVADQTPIDGEKNVSVGLDKIIDMDLNELNYPSPRVSGVGLLPQDVYVDMQEEPGLEPLIEQQDEAGNLTEANSDFEDEGAEMSKKFKGHQKCIMTAINREDDVAFHVQYPSKTTNRRDAVLGFYTALSLHRHGKLKLRQTELFGEITMSLP